MAAVDSATSAARLPGPPELLPGRPDAIVDLQTDEGVAIVGGRWRYADARVEEIEFVELGSPDDPLGPGSVPNRTYDVVTDDDWLELSPADTQLRLANGRVCFNRYAIDDYAEVWVNGNLPFALGDTGGPVVAGFNAPNRVVLTRAAQPGDTFSIEVFGINGPILTSPRNYIWMRTATLDVYASARAAVSVESPLEVEGGLAGIV